MSGYSSKPNSKTLVKKGVTECSPFPGDAPKELAMGTVGPSEKPQGIKKTNISTDHGKFRFR